MRFTPYKYQRRAIDWVLSRERCALFLDMGLGKSVISLTAVQQLINTCEVDRVLVVAPKKVAESTWTGEASKWDHLTGLRVEKVMGTEKKRLEALSREADVYVISRDSITWLMKSCKGKHNFDMIVIDELSSFKSPKSQRFKAMKLASAGARRVVGLTGTPAPNGMIDLWAQMYCIDLGERLGKSFTKFRDTYFQTITWNNVVVKCKIKPGQSLAITEKICDICITMKAKDYLQLPALIPITHYVDLSPDMAAAYQAFERDRVMEFHRDHDGESASVLAMSAAALMNKLSQYSNGAIYDEDHNVYRIHDEKLDHLAEIMDGVQDSGVLVFYQYKHDASRIVERFGKVCRVKIYEGAEDLEAWNRREIDMLLAHPASTAYGLNMQQGGNYVVWFGLGWNLELYQQANARLHRQGQSKPVFVYHLLCRGTVDEQAERALGDKNVGQEAMLASLKGLMNKYL